MPPIIPDYRAPLPRRRRGPGGRAIGGALFLLLGLMVIPSHSETGARYWIIPLVLWATGLSILLTPLIRRLVFRHGAPPGGG